MAAVQSEPPVWENALFTLVAQVIVGLSEDETLDAHTAVAVGCRAAALLAAWGQNVETQTAAFIHNFVYKDPALLDAVAAVLGARVAYRAGELCKLYAQIVLDDVNIARGQARTRQRVRHFVCAYRDPDLGLLAAALLWAGIEQRRQAPGGNGASALEDARLVLCPYLDMLGMQALREELNQALWPIAVDPAVEAAGQELAAQLSRSVSAHLPAAVCQRRFPCHEGQPGPARSSTRPIAPIDIAVCAPDVEDCYRVLYHLHHHYQQVEGSFSDHLRAGRINGWRALQTAISVPWQGDRARVNFQIYAQSMEAVNRWGLAAHRRDPEGSPGPANAWWRHAANGQTLIELGAIGALPEALAVFSPQGQLFRFHRGCTVVDFAYHVHTELADQCRRFYINDEPVEPNAVLHHLDIVALEHDPQAPGPTQVWLNAAHTARARNAIERFLNRRGQGMDQGRRILDERRQQLEQHYGFNLPEHRLAQAFGNAVRELRLNRPEDLLDELASGRMAVDQLLHPLFAEEIARQIRLPRGMRLRPHQIQVSQCCRPRLGEDIVGLVNRRHGQITRMRVHRRECVRAHGDHESVPLTWRLQPRLTVSEQLEVTAHDEDELLGDAVRQVYALLPHVTLRKVEAGAHHGVARLRFHLEAESQEVVEELMANLNALPNRQIVEVRRLRLPPSELEMAESSHGRAPHNPYSRLPVHEQAMFFGRSRELERILELLRAGVGNIWLLGQKRVGKTSLLFHLKHHFLPERGYTAAFVDFQLLGNLAAGNLCYEIAAAVFADLQGDPRFAEGGSPLTAPLRSLFDAQPVMELIAYLRAAAGRLQATGGRTRLVLLLDEFSRATDAYLQGQLDRSFFDVWRGVVQATAPDISYITVVQQQTYNTLARRAQQNMEDPSWHIMELGEKLVLRPLEGDAVRRLIEWPMRNFLEFSPDSVDEVATLTGGNPFLIQAFCFKLATHMAHQERRRIERADIEAVRMEFMLPTESVFAHFLDMLRGIGNQVCQTLAHLVDDGAKEAGAGAAPMNGAQDPNRVSWAAIHAALPALPEPALRRALQELVTCDILYATELDVWSFSSRLFQQWLALNAE